MVLVVCKVVMKVAYLWVVSMRHLPEIITGFQRGVSQMCQVHTFTQLSSDETRDYIDHKGYDCLVLQGLVVGRCRFMNVSMKGNGRVHDDIFSRLEPYALL